MTDEDGFVDFFNDLIPEGCVPMHAVRVVAYMDKDGDCCTSFTVHGTREMVPILGSLEWVKLAVFERRYEDDDDA